MIKFINLILIVIGCFCSSAKRSAGMKSEVVYPDSALMQEVYEEVKTPYKYGIILRGEEGALVDCPQFAKIAKILNPELNDLTEGHAAEKSVEEIDKFLKKQDYGLTLRKKECPKARSMHWLSNVWYYPITKEIRELQPKKKWLIWSDSRMNIYKN